MQKGEVLMVSETFSPRQRGSERLEGQRSWVPVEFRRRNEWLLTRQIG